MVVGANEGHTYEETLRFADKDAERMAEVLRALADVPDANIVVLRNVTAQRFDAALASVATRIEADKAAGDEPVLFVYYSGHADADSLHLRGTDMPLKQLRRRLETTPAQLKILVIDACRSGEITRVKGVVPSESFEFRAEDKLETEGLAIITSSAAGEDAQESDRLRGGIFTHHFVNGLRGAADRSGDDKVTLSEAYQYGYQQTLETTSRARFTQHPTYSFATKGREEIVLTRVNLAESGHLVLANAGSFTIFRRGKRGDLMAELNSPERTSLVMPPGVYLVRLREGKHVFEAHARVWAGRTTTVSKSDMQRLHVGRTVRKGYTQRALALALTIDGGAGRFVSTDFGTTAIAHAGLKLDFSPLTLHIRGRYGYSRYRPSSRASDPGVSGVGIRQYSAGADLGLLKLFDVGRFAPGIGVRAGADWVWQVFDSPGVAPTRGQLVANFGPVLRFEYAAAPQVILSLDLGTDIYVVSGTNGINVPVVPHATLGLGFYLF